jgi:ATP-dependent DNA helicase RecG
MALPININDLINGQVVESERLEFKKGWNPEDIVHTICAFANDINNLGGGYLIVGVEEKNGRPILPPVGVPPDNIDKYQKELLNLCHKIVPNYFPVFEHILFKKKHIIVIWVPGGDTRPYKAPIALGKRESQKNYYVRRYSITRKASVGEEAHLIEIASKVPFDDRMNHSADLTSLKLPLIKSFLQEIKSGLYAQADKIPFWELCRQMRIVQGPDEYLKPINAGLLFFNDAPQRFFRGACIEVIIYHDEVGDKFTEKTFEGPLHGQLRDAMGYIKNNVLKEQVIKVKGQAESIRYYNFPYEAIEEALANAVYHRSYELQNPIEVNVRPDVIEILSFPGALPPIDNKALSKDRVIARDYRNRRIGDFLKELHLTEGRGTGVPKIRRAMKINGSPEPTLKTDKARTHFLVKLPVRPNSIDLGEEALQILMYCLTSKSRKQVFEKIKVSNQTWNYENKIAPLIRQGYLTLTLPDAPKSNKQRYVTTDLGRAALK